MLLVGRNAALNQISMTNSKRGHGNAGGNGNGNGQTLPQGTVLALAFNDLNDNNVYDKKDMLIAALSDTNNDNAVSIGDTVTFGQYPLQHRRYRSWNIPKPNRNGYKC